MTTIDDPHVAEPTTLELAIDRVRASWARAHECLSWDPHSSEHRGQLADILSVVTRDRKAHTFALEHSPDYRYLIDRHLQHQAFWPCP